MSVTGRRYLLANLRLKTTGEDGDLLDDKGILEILNDEKNIRKEGESESDEEEKSEEESEEQKQQRIQKKLREQQEICE